MNSCRRKLILAPMYFVACFLAVSALFVVFALLSSLVFYLAYDEMAAFDAVRELLLRQMWFLNHFNHPFKCIAVVAASYAAVATCWTLCRDGSVVGWRRRIQVWLIMLISAAIASPLCGMLYSLYDMLAGFFPTNWEDKVLRDVMFVIVNTPILMLLFLPCSLICFVAGHYITIAVDSRWRRVGLQARGTDAPTSAAKQEGR